MKLVETLSLPQNGSSTAVAPSGGKRYMKFIDEEASP